MELSQKEQLLREWKLMRGDYFNRLDEDINKFNKKYQNHPLYDSVTKNFDKDFKIINQIASDEIDSFLSS